MKKTTLIFSMMMVALLVSCNRELDIPVVSEGDTISVPLSLSVSSLENGFGEDPSAYTKAGAGQDDRIQDTGNGTATPIKNVFVLQFDGTTDAAKLVSWSYVGNYTTGSDIELKATDVENRIVFLANTFSPATRFPLGMTVAELKTYSIKNVLDSKGVFGAEEVSDGNFLYYPMFSGDIIVENVEAGTVLTCTLKRNIARINVTVVNQASSTADEIQITSVKLKSVPGVSVNYTNYEGTTDFSAFPTTNFPADGSFKTIDYEPMNWSPDGGNEQTFTFYAPLNLRGTITNTDEKQKNTLAPATATRCEVTATYKSGANNYPVTYTFVLGADMISDCNLLPNKSYSYTFTIKQKGNPDIDPRVEDWGPVDFTPSTTPRSNCYILNPPSASGMTRKFLIPIDRVREFWGNNGYENDLTRAMMGGYATQTWTAKILWSDFKIENDNLTLTKSTGNGSQNEYFEVEVAGGVSGNAVVALYLGDGSSEDIIWSWHLWITDYNPDYASRKKIVPEPENGKYIYDVPGGAVHSYNTAPFKTGICKGRFIMDRNLGAPDVINHGSSTGTVFFQFGRKDPFACGALYKPDGTTVSISNIAWDATTQESTKKGKNVPYSVQNPMKFITSSSTWTTGDQYCPLDGGDFLWQDPKSAPSADGKVKKSIFDPCPSGWMVPANGMLDGLATSSAVHSSKISPMPFNGTGRYYYPDKNNNADYIYFPFIGNRTTSFSNRDGYYWLASPSATMANSFQLNDNTSQYPKYGTSERYVGCAVRCIQEYF